MNTSRTILVIAVLLLACTGLVSADETPWCDMANCAMCKSISSRPDLMNSMSTEIHDISDGMIQICSVMPAQMAAYQTAMAEMDATGKKLQAGEKLPLCGMCQAFGGLMAAGAKLDMIPTKFGSVEMLRASSPETVAQIHAWAERTRTEMAKMMNMEKAKTGN